MNRGILFICLTLLVAGSAYAGHLELYRRFCLEELVPVIDDPRIHVPVGCEVVDCCPGCPGPPIDWQILVQGDPLRAVDLVFENLPGATREKLKITGSAKWIDNNTLRVSAGRAVVSGFPADAGNPPVAQVKFDVDRSKLSRPQPAGTGAQADRAVNLEIRQQLGGIIVNETIARYAIYPCGPPPPPPTDRLRITNNAGGDSSLALLDARRASGCVNDEAMYLTNTRDVGSVLSNGVCNSEIAVFSTDDAMQLRTNVMSWTNALGDLTTVDLTPDVLNTPLSVWVMRGTFANTSMRVATDRARATQLYNTMKVGTIVSVAALRDATGDPDTPGLLNAACGSAANLRSQIGFDAGRLNVYYLNDPGARGWWCGNNTIIVGSGADNESLAHEIGHAFTLAHTNGIAGISNTNLMITGGTGRNSITKGQAFRCNVNTTSTMNTNGTRAGVTRSCPDGTTSVTCPALSLNP